ncbi:MAG: hypothetical protein GWN37_00170 [Gammaproteobacteria bacterium]|nr:hypothetical protein [Gammaproteobacteria bacterium]NIV73287.1 hypothetical protein [Gammaproteobacteria bacterium]
MIVTPFLAMWAPNLIMSVLGGIGLWRIRRQGCARRTGRRERGSPARTIPREVPA